MLKFAWRMALVALVGWVGYIAAQAGWTYYATQDAIDKALREAAVKYRAPLRSGTLTEAMLLDVRDRLIRDVGQGRLPVRAADIAVSPTAAGFSATIQYSLPIITHQGTDLLAVPVSLRRSPDGGFQS